MVDILWRGEPFTVRRLVYAPADWPAGGRAVAELAARAGLAAAAGSAAPAPGDFWLGCSPPAGWGGTDLTSVAWASFVDAPLVLDEIRAAVLSDLLTLDDDQTLPPDRRQTDRHPAVTG